jgi:antirestriction protein ArdC
MARDIYAEVTDKIIAQIEAGSLPWVKPWTNAEGCNSGLPVNYSTGKAYRGINVLMLWASGFPDQRWLTFKQAQAIGANVRKGEHGSLVVFYKKWDLKDTNASVESVTKSIPILRSFTVFNVSQIDGLKTDAAPVEPRPITYTRAAELLAQATMAHGGNRAFYSPANDSITLPRLEQFASEADYFVTGLHELTHWTGHKSRLARDFSGRFGTDAYAFEELIAEMGAAFLCADSGIEYTTQHASYIESWLRVLKADKKAILTAASQAQKAADFCKLIDTAEESEEGDAVLCA